MCTAYTIKHLHCCDCILIPTSSRAIRRLTYSSMHTHTCVVRFEFRYYFWTYRALGITLTKCLDQVVPIPNPSIDHESSVFIAVFEPQSLHVVFRFHPIPLLHQLSVCWDIQNSSAFGWHAQLRCFADMVNVSEGERGAWCGLGFQLSHQSWVNHGSVTFIYTFPF